MAFFLLSKSLTIAKRQKDWSIIVCVKNWVKQSFFFQNQYWWCHSFNNLLRLLHTTMYVCVISYEKKSPHTCENQKGFLSLWSRPIHHMKTEDEKKERNRINFKKKGCFVSWCITWRFLNEDFFLWIVVLSFFFFFCTYRLIYLCPWNIYITSCFFIIFIIFIFIQILLMKSLIFIVIKVNDLVDQVVKRIWCKDKKNSND